MGPVILGVIALVVLAVVGGLVWALVAKKALPAPPRENVDARKRNREQGMPPPVQVSTQQVRTPDMRNRPPEHAPPEY